MKPPKLYLIITLILAPIISNAQEQILMEKEGGVYKIPCTINGLKLKFIFDTGASDVSISLSEAAFMLKNDYLSKSDIRGSEYYQIANGEVVEGTTIILREVQIGSRKLFNVEASVVHSLSSPLLLGQSALSKLGSYSFDYERNVLVLGDNNHLIAKYPTIAPSILKDIEFLSKGCVESSTGLFYKRTKVGQGKWPTNGQRATINYSMYLWNGDYIDSNVEEIAIRNGAYQSSRKYEPFEVEVGPNAPLILAWREILQMMRAGDGYKIIIPPHLGYGDRGAGGNQIPPNSWLVCDIEMVEIKN